MVLISRKALKAAQSREIEMTPGCFRGRAETAPSGRVQSLTVAGA